MRNRFVVGRLSRVGVLLALGSLALGLPSVFAKGPPGQATIVGTGISQSLEVTDPELLESLESLQNYERETPAPPWFHDFYVITRSFQEGAEYIPFDQVLYVPNEGGRPGWVYYVGVYDGWGSNDGKWFQAVPENEAALRALLAGRPEAAVAIPTYVEAVPAGPTLLPAGALGALAGAGGMAGVMAVHSTRQGRGNRKPEEESSKPG